MAMSRSSSSVSSSNDETNYYCHKCNQFVTRLYAGTKCHLCRTEFIEEVDLNDPQTINNLLLFDSNRPGVESDLDQTFDDVFEGLSDSDIEEQSPGSTSRTTLDLELQRSRSEDSLIGFIGTNLLSHSRTFSLLAEEFGFNPDNIVINAGDILSRILAQIMGTGSQPMVPRDIESIPVAVISEEQVANGSQCAVCMEFFKVEEMVRKLVCDHCFHYECIQPWLSLHSNCPTCRQDLNNS